MVSNDNDTSTYCVHSPVLSACRGFCLNVMNNPRVGLPLNSSYNEEAEAQKGEVVGLKSRSCWAAEVGFESRSPRLGDLMSRDPSSCTPCERLRPTLNSASFKKYHWARHYCRPREGTGPAWVQNKTVLLEPGPLALWPGFTITHGASSGPRMWFPALLWSSEAGAPISSLSPGRVPGYRELLIFLPQATEVWD